MTRGFRLFNKNVGPCKSVRTGIGADTCPLSVREVPVQRNQAPINGGGNYDPRPRGSLNPTVCWKPRETCSIVWENAGIDEGNQQETVRSKEM